MNPNYLDFEQPIAELEVKIDELSLVSNDGEVNLGDEIGRLKVKSSKLTEKIYAGLKPWDIVRVARHPLRPYSQAYFERLFNLNQISRQGRTTCHRIKPPWGPRKNLR